MATTEQFSLRWNNFHSNISSGFHQLWEAAEMVDVTLAVDGHILQAHKLVLSICSPYFKEIFKSNPCTHPVVILKDVAHENMKDILEFMYMGEVNVLRDNLSAFLRTAEHLQVKGLTGDDSSDETSSRKDDKSDSIQDQDDEPDMLQFNQIDSDLELREQTPPPPPLPQPICKRSSKHYTMHGCTKKAKHENMCTLMGMPTCHKSIDHSEKSCEKWLKAEDETKSDGLKQLIENNFPNSSSSGIIDNSPDQDILYSMDHKGHVFCPYCCRKFVNRYNLKVHIRDKHEDNPINLDCRVCGKIMRNRSCLRVHLYHHRKQNLDTSTSDPTTSNSIVESII